MERIRRLHPRVSEQIERLLAKPARGEEQREFRTRLGVHNARLFELAREPPRLVKPLEFEQGFDEQRKVVFARDFARDEPQVSERALVLAPPRVDGREFKVHVGAVGREPVRGDENLQSLLRAVRRQEQLAEVGLRADVRRRGGERAAEQPFRLSRALLLRPHDAEQVQSVGVSRGNCKHGVEQRLRLRQTALANRRDRLPQAA